MPLTKRNPNFTPSPELRTALSMKMDRTGASGPTAALNEIWNRYAHLIKSGSIDLTPDEREVLHMVCMGTFMEPVLIECLASEVADSDAYLANVPAAHSLYEKFKSASYAELLATVERLGL